MPHRIVSGFLGHFSAAAGVINSRRHAVSRPAMAQQPVKSEQRHGQDRQRAWLRRAEDQDATIRAGRTRREAGGAGRHEHLPRNRIHGDRVIGGGGWQVLQERIGQGIDDAQDRRGPVGIVVAISQEIPVGGGGVQASSPPLVCGMDAANCARPVLVGSMTSDWVAPLPQTTSILPPGPVTRPVGPQLAILSEANEIVRMTAPVVALISEMPPGSEAEAPICTIDTQNVPVVAFQVGCSIPPAALGVAPAPLKTTWLPRVGRGPTLMIEEKGRESRRCSRREWCWRLDMYTISSTRPDAVAPPIAVEIGVPGKAVKVGAALVPPTNLCCLTASP